MAVWQQSTEKGSTMQVTITEDRSVEDILVALTCPSINEQVSRIVASLRMYENRLYGLLEGKTHLLASQDVFYLESVEGRTFIYTKDKTYESPLRLFEMEEKLSNTEFVRISKQMLVNFNKVRAIKPDFNARLQLILSNDEVVVVSRQYAPVIKKKIQV